MNPAGHFAVGYLVSRRDRAALLPVWLGTFLPDLIDKPLMLVGYTPYGRTIGHSLFFWGATAVLGMLARAWRLARARTVLAVLVGGLAHLVVDLLDDAAMGLERSGYAFSAWMGWPRTNPDMWSVRVPHLFAPDNAATTSLELLTLLVCTIVLIRARRQ